MPRPDLYPADIMDKCQAFSDALNAYLLLAPDFERAWKLEWERRYSPSQTRIPAGQPGGGRWTDGGGGGSPLGADEDLPSARDMDRYRPKPAVYRPGADTEYVIQEVAHVLPEDAIRSMLQQTPTTMDPNVGVVRGQPVSPPDTTHPGMPYVEARSRGELNSLLGSAGPKRQRHHIVPEHSLGSIPDRPNDPRTVHNSGNLTDLKEEEHTCVTGLYNQNIQSGGPLFRDAIKGLPFGVQYSIGLEVIDYCKEKRKREAEGQSVESFVREPRSFLPKQPEEAAEPSVGPTANEPNLPSPILPFRLPRSGGGSPPLGGSFAPAGGYPVGGGGGTGPLMKRTYIYSNTSYR
ncbi:MAG: hypothetical protein ACOVVK_23510 [Elsteraceae bacterium]